MEISDFEKHGNFLAVKKVMLRINRKRNLILRDRFISKIPFLRINIF